MQVAVFDTRFFKRKCPFLQILISDSHLSIPTQMRKRTCIMMLWNAKEAHLLQSLLCFRVSRTKWRGGNIEDGAGMPYIPEE